MSIMNIFKGMTGSEIEGMFNNLDDALDEYFGQHGERRRFMEACRKLSYSDIKIIQNVMGGAKKTPDHLSLANEIENPLRAADAILMLEEELQKTKDTEFLLFLMNLTQRDNVFIALNRARFLDWEYPLLENKHLPAEFIEYLWSSNKDGRYQDVERYETLRTISKHPNCPLVVLEELYKEDDPVVRKAIARHRNIDESLTNVFLNSSRLVEREQIANSRYVSKEALLSLMRDKYDRVSGAAKKQFNKRFSDKIITDKIIDNAVQKMVDKPYVKPTNIKKKFDVYIDARMGIEHAKSLKPSQRASIAKIADKEIVEALADDKSKTVRRSVAANYFCPDEVLMSYLTDSDSIIVNNAILNIARRRPEVIFEDILSNDVIDVSYNLLNTYLNDKGSFDPLRDKMDTKTESEIERTYIVAQYTNNPMIQMRIVNDLTQIPSSQIRWELLRKLSDNLHLIDAIIRKIAIELNFGSEKVLRNYKSINLVMEYLSQDKIPNGVRMRLEQHIESLGS